MAATKTKSRAKKAPTPTKSGKAKPTAKAKPKAAAKKAAAPASKKPTAAKAKKPAAAKAKAKAKKPAPPPVVDVDDVMDAPAAEPGADESSNGDLSETAKTGAFARIKKGVGSFFSKIARKKQQPADDADAGDEPPPTIEVATGDILVEAEDRAKLRAGKKPPPPPQPNDDDE